MNAGIIDHYITIDELVKDEVYVLAARNFNIGRWLDNYRFEFQGIRDKFGIEYFANEVHWDADGWFGTAKPIRIATQEEKDQWLNKVKELED